MASTLAASTVGGYLGLNRRAMAADEAEDELSRTLHRVLKISIVVVLLSGAAVPFSMQKMGPTFLVHALFGFFLVASYACFRAGYRRASGAVLAGGFWLVATFAVFAFGGVHSPGVFVYLPVVATAGLFWSRRAATGLALASAGSVLFAAQLQALGALPHPLAPIPPERQWTVFTGSLLITAVLFLSAARRLATLARDLAQSKTVLEDLASAQARAENERNELEHHLMNVERLESVGRLAGGVAHDFNNLLSVIMNSATILRREVPRDSVSSELIGEIDQATMRATELVKKLLACSSGQTRAPKPVDLNAVLDGLSSILKRLSGPSTTIVVEARAERATVLADASELEQVIVNLALNARDAMPHGGRLSIETSSVAAKPGTETGEVALVVTDQGVGMDPATARRIFEPFFTTKGSAGGTGLGLASVKRIVDESGGRIHVETAPGKGARFEVVLPLTKSAVRRDAETRLA